jgi:hypothetical protein
MAPGRRSRLHQRMGEWLEQTYGTHASAVREPTCPALRGRTRLLTRDPLLDPRCRKHGQALCVPGFDQAPAARPHARCRSRCQRPAEFEIELWSASATRTTGSARRSNVPGRTRQKRRGLPTRASHQLRSRHSSCLIRPFGLIDSGPRNCRHRASGATQRRLRRSPASRLHRAARGSTRLWYDSWCQKDWDLWRPRVSASAASAILGCLPITG